VSNYEFLTRGCWSAEWVCVCVNKFWAISKRFMYLWHYDLKDTWEFKLNAFIYFAKIAVKMPRQMYREEYSERSGPIVYQHTSPHDGRLMNVRVFEVKVGYFAGKFVWNFDAEIWVELGGKITKKCYFDSTLDYLSNKKTDTYSRIEHSAVARVFWWFYSFCSYWPSQLHSYYSSRWTTRKSISTTFCLAQTRRLSEYVYTCFMLNDFWSTHDFQRQNLLENWCFIKFS
jgi:hypothetical protein